MNNFKLPYIGVVIALVLFFATKLPFHLLASYVYSLESIYAFLIPEILGYIVLFITLYFIYIRNKNYNVDFKLTVKNTLLPILLLLVGTMLLSGVINTTLSEVFKLDTSQYKEIEELLNGYALKSPLILFFMVVIMAPICEELFFRGFLLQGMLNNKILPTVAIAISAILFGAMHGNIVQGISGAIIGTLFGFIYYKTKSILWTILLHAFNNFLGFLLIISKLKLPKEKLNEIEKLNGEHLSLHQGLTMFIIGLLFMIVGYLWFIKKLKKNE